MSLTNVADQQRQLRQGCERCGAGAVQQVTLPSGADLRFCGHHYNEHKDAFAALGYTVVALSGGKPAESHPLF
jgi:uncharacterized protein (DUF983 family)